jgi:hypothetical protein
LTKGSNAQTHSTSVGIDEMLGSALFPTEQESINSQARQITPANANTANSKTRLLKVALLPVYLFVWWYILFMLVNIKTDIDEGLLTLFEGNIFENALTFTMMLAGPVVLLGLMTNFYLRA